MVIKLADNTNPEKWRLVDLQPYEILHTTNVKVTGMWIDVNGTLILAIDGYLGQDTVEVSVGGRGLRLREADNGAS